MTLQLGGTHPGVAAGPAGAEAAALPLSRGHHTRPHGPGRLATPRASERRGVEGRDVHDEIESIEQRTGQPPAVASDLVRRAAAAAVPAATVTARTPLRCLSVMPDWQDGSQGRRNIQRN